MLITCRKFHLNRFSILVKWKKYQWYGTDIGTTGRGQCENIILPLQHILQRRNTCDNILLENLLDPTGTENDDSARHSNLSAALCDLDLWPPNPWDYRFVPLPRKPLMPLSIKIGSFVTDERTDGWTNEHFIALLCVLYVILFYMLFLVCGCCLLLNAVTCSAGPSQGKKRHVLRSSWPHDLDCWRRHWPRTSGIK